MRATPVIATQIEGTLEELMIASLTQAAPPPAPPTIEEVTKVLGELCFIVETVAHLQKQEKGLLPTAEAGREMIKRLQPTEFVEG